MHLTYKLGFSILFLPIVLSAQVNFQTLDINALKTNVASDGSLEETRTVLSNKSLCYTTELWLASQDSVGNLAVAAQMFRQFGVDYIPGPISSDTNARAKYNRVWKINKTMIDSFAAGLFTGLVPPAIAQWPAHGNTAFGESFYLAPFVDVNNNGYYSPKFDGDYPCILGDQAIFFVFNDDTIHTTTGAAKLGVEVLGMAYAYQNSTFLDSVQFVNYTIRAKQRALPNFTAAVFSDFDLGFPNDDIVGTFVDQNAVIVYNGDSIDYLPLGFGANPPATGLVVLNGMATFVGDGLDNDKDGCVDGLSDGVGTCLPVDSSLNRLEYWRLANTILINSSNSTYNGSPQMPLDYWNYMHGNWRDGSQMFVETPSGFMDTGNGDGYIAGGVGMATKFSFSGNTFDTSSAFFPTSDQNWFESPDDRSDKRIVTGMGEAAELSKDMEFHIKIALFMARDTNSLNSYDAAYKMAFNINNYLDLTTPLCSGSRLINIEENAVSKTAINIYPNPAQNWLVVSSTDLTRSQGEIYSYDGRLVMEFDLDQNSQKTLDVSKLPAGIYVLRIENQSQRFVIAR